MYNSIAPTRTRMPCVTASLTPRGASWGDHSPNGLMLRQLGLCLQIVKKMCWKISMTLLAWMLAYTHGFSTVIRSCALKAEADSFRI